jgi:serine/threonine protein kinase
MGSLQISGPDEKHAVPPAQPASPASELKSVFNARYEILSEVGRGAMGVVYKAHDRVIGRTVALKTILVGHGAPDHDEVIQRFKSEAKAAGSLDHPNIITIYDVGHDGERVYLSMQFVEGSTLAAMLDGTNLRPGQLTLLSYAEQICNAVAFAHERGVIHRDLKPSNLMLTPEGQIKVLDFGIAKQGDASLTKSGMVVGTPAYMAPEQATGKEVDQRSDIFSLGAVFYELFTGKKAFHADAVTAVLYRVVHDEPEPPMAVNPMVPVGLDAAIRRALEKDPSLRFQNCVELRDTLRREAVLLRTSSAKILAKPLLESGNHKRLMASQPKQRRVLPVVLSVCFILAAAAIVAWPQRTRIPKLMRFISFVQQMGKHQRGNEVPPAVEPANASAPEPTKPTETASSQSALIIPVAASGVTNKADVTGQDATAVLPQATAATSQIAPATDGNENKGGQPVANSLPVHAALPAGTKDAKNETEPAQQTASLEEQLTEHQTNDAIAADSTEGATTSRHVRGAVPPAPTVVEGFTRKDISDLLRKADAAAGSGDYKSAIYEYDIVVRLDRANVKAREGLRRSREAEKERR